MTTLTLRQRLNPQRFLRGYGPEAGPVRLDRARIFILPNSAGLMFGVLLLVMLIGAINYNLSLGYAFTFMLGSLAVVSILHTYRNLALLTVRAGNAEPVFAGGTASFEILIDNPGPHTRHGVCITLPGQPDVRINPVAGTVTRVTLARPAPRRGELALGRFRVTTRYPLGLFTAWSNINLNLHCLVYPHPGPRRTPLHRSGYRPHQRGHKGRGVDDFAGFRAYRHGDSARHLFWKAAARGQPLMTKQFTGDRADERWFDWHELHGMDTEARLSQLCRWIIDARRHHEHYGLTLPGQTFSLAGGESHYRQCMAALARFGLPS